jgi:hypothetical protein
MAELERSLFGGGRRGGGFLEAVGSTELFAEPLDAAGGVYEFLLAGKERMADAADVHVDLGHGAAGDEGVSAGAVDVAFLISGMDFGFHSRAPLPGRA